MKKLTRKPSFNDYADKAAANHWRSRCCPWSRELANESDSKVLAKIRKRNQNLDGHGCGWAEPTFRCPTNCKSGFFNVLLHISKNPGERTKILENWAGVKSLAMTLRRLTGAKLIVGRLENGITEWYVTEFGKQYLMAAFNEFNVY